MPIQSQINQYRGVNAHLHSYVQAAPNRWRGFHIEHTAHLLVYLSEHLPPGYGVQAGVSLQHAEQTLWIDKSHPDEHLKCAVIYAGNNTNPIIQIELLSVESKPPGDYAAEYHRRRADLLGRGLMLVELDYLHQSQPVLPHMPAYVMGAQSASPYSLLITRGDMTTVYGFAVDEPIPVVNLPLRDDDTIAVNFNAIYQRTYAENQTFGPVLVDYAEPPLNIDSYSAADRQRIAARMNAVRAAAARGHDLESGPFPLLDES